MNNTTVQSKLRLFEVTNFSSSAVQTLWFGQAPNGHDMIAVKWSGSDNVYAYTYNGIIETFLFYMELNNNSVGFAMSQTKLRHDFADYYLDNINHGKDLKYALNIEWCVPVDKFGEHTTSITQLCPTDAVLWLSELEILSREESPFIQCMRIKN
jgi:hypothetical protein